MNDNEPLLPRGVLSDSPTQSAGRPRFAIDWDAVTTVAKGPLPFTEQDRADIEAAAWRYRQEVEREHAGDGIGFADIREHARKITEAIEALQGLLAHPKARALTCVPAEELERLHAEATRVETSDAAAPRNAYSFDLRENLLHLLAHRWHAAGHRADSATFYRIGAEVLRQVGMGGAIRSREMPVRKVVAAILEDGGFDAELRFGSNPFNSN